VRASAGLSLALVLALVTLGLCGVSLVMGAVFCVSRSKSRARMQAEGEMDAEVNECEHDGVGALPITSNVTVKQPTFDIDDVSMSQADFPEAEDEEPEAGMFMDVGKDRTMRRRFAL